MKYDFSFFDEPIDRRGTDCEKWDCIMRREKRELLPMWVADMDFRCADEIVEALRERAAHPVYGYTEQGEDTAKAFSGFMKRRHGIDVPESAQGLLPCVITGLRAAIRALTYPGDGVILQPPVYGPFFSSTELNVRRLLENPLVMGEDGRYHMDFDDLESKCRDGARLMLLCSPHNPVGRVWTRDELERLLAMLRRYGIILVSDEIHEDFVYEKGAFLPAASLIKSGDRVLTLTSASKTFNIAGLQQAAYYASDAELKAAMDRELEASGVTSGNIFALVGTRAAYEHGDAWLDGLIRYLDAARVLFERQVKERLPKAVMTPLDATYLAWLDLRAYGHTTDELMRLTHERGVAFTPGTFFGKAQGEGFLRVNLACPHSQTTEAVKRLSEALIK